MSRISLLEYAKLAQNTYFSTEENLPAGWVVFSTCPEKYQIKGYSGKCFIRKNADGSIDVVFGQRGTANIDGVIVDFKYTLDEVIPEQYTKGAAPYIKDTLRDLEFLFPNCKKNYAATGHSLGGTLASYLMRDVGNGAFVDTMKAVVFESSGFNGPANMQVLSFMYENTISIKHRPDLPNCVYSTPSKHQYTISIHNDYPTPFDELPLPWMPTLSEYIYEYSFRDEHLIAKTVQWLEHNPESAMQEVYKWPVGLMPGYHAWLNYRTNQAYWNGRMQKLWYNNGYSSVLLQAFYRYNYLKFYQAFIYYNLEQNPDKLAHNHATPLGTENGVNAPESKPETAVDIQGLKNKIAALIFDHDRKLSQFFTLHKDRKVIKREALNAIHTKLIQLGDFVSHTAVQAIFDEVAAQYQHDPRILKGINSRTEELFNIYASPRPR